MYYQWGRQDKLQWWFNRCVMLLRSSGAADMWLIQNCGGMDSQRSLKKKVTLLLNQTWVCLPTHSKTNLLTLGNGEGKCSVYCRCKQGDHETQTQKTQAMWGTGLQDAWSTHAQFSEGLAPKWSFKHHQHSGFNQSRVSLLRLAVFVWCGSASYKTTQECVSGLYLYLLGNWEFGDSAMWLVYNLNCYQLVCFFPQKSILCFYLFIFHNH